MRLGHVAEERDGVVDGGDGGVGLEERVMEAKVEWGFRGGGGNDGVDELLGIREVWGFEKGRWGRRGGILGFPGKLG